MVRGQALRAKEFSQLAGEAATAYELSMTGAEMRELRTKLGWTQQRLAHELGLSATQVANYERGVIRKTGRQVVIPRTVELACKMLEVMRDRGEI